MKRLLLTLVVLSLCLCANAQNVVRSTTDNAVNSLNIQANDSAPTFTLAPPIQMKVDILNSGFFGTYGNYTHVIQVMQEMNQYHNAFSSEYDDIVAFFPGAMEIFNATSISVSDNAYFTGVKYSSINELNESDYNTQITSTIEDSHYLGRFSGGTGSHSLPVLSVSVGSTTYQLNETWCYTPIVLDMDGDGKLEASKGNYKPHPYTGVKLVPFDLNGDNFDDMVEWVGANDGLLLQYTPGEKVNGTHLFGNAGGWCHGFEKLGTLDKNQDGMLKDEELATLSVWQDRNSNGLVDAGEVRSVKELGITMIKVTHSEDMVSSFEQNGATKKMWDWYPTAFKANKTK